MTAKPSAQAQTLLRHYARILRQWPTDYLRPVSFQTSMQKRLRDRFVTPTATASPSDSYGSARARAEATAANVQGRGGAVESMWDAPSKPAPTNTSTADLSQDESQSNDDNSSPTQQSLPPTDHTPTSTSAPEPPVVPAINRAARVMAMTPDARIKDETGQVNALYSLLENRYQRQYPCSEKLLRPRGNEGYYERMAQEMEEAPRRSWLGWKLLRLAGLVRLR